MRTILSKSAFALAFTTALMPACKGGKKPLGDKSAACTNIYKTYLSHQDMKVWMDACTAAPDENIRCVNLVMDEGKDDDCKKLMNSEARNTLVRVLNGKPEAAAPPPVAPPPADPAPAGSAAPPAGSDTGSAAAAPPPEPAKPFKPGLGDGIVLEFVKAETDGDATFKVTNKTPSCAVKSLGYHGYAYDKAGKQLGGSGAGKNYETPLAVGASKESKFSASSKYTADGIAQIVITSVECADGTKWEDSSRAPVDRAMTPAK